MRHLASPRQWIVLAASMAALASTAAAQTQSHEVSVTVPATIGLRIVGTGTGPRSVTFAYGSNPQAYTTAVEQDELLPPTAVSRFADVQLNVTRRGRWRLHVQASTFVFTGSAAPTGLALSDIQVIRSGPQDAVNGSGGSATYASTWTLSTTGIEIASSPNPTGGWRSLGFSGWDYRLTVDGDETPGTYTTVVTYSLIAP